MDGRPWAVSIVLLAIGVGSFVALRNQRKERAGFLALLGAIAAAVGLQIAAELVVTERERMSEATMELVRATAGADTARLEGLLAEDVRVIATAELPGWTVPLGGLDKGATLAAVSDLLGSRHTPDEYAVLELQAQQTGRTLGRTQVRVRVSVERIPGLSWWRIDWRKDPRGEWRAIMIELIERERFGNF
jgi:hypothetical protein